MVWKDKGGSGSPGAANGVSAKDLPVGLKRTTSSPSLPDSHRSARRRAAALDCLLTRYTHSLHHELTTWPYPILYHSEAFDPAKVVGGARFRGTAWVF